MATQSTGIGRGGKAPWHKKRGSKPGQYRGGYGGSSANEKTEAELAVERKAQLRAFEQALLQEYLRIDKARAA